MLLNSEVKKGEPGSGTGWPASAEHRERAGESSGTGPGVRLEKEPIQRPWIAAKGERREREGREDLHLDREAMAWAALLNPWLVWLDFRMAPSGHFFLQHCPTKVFPGTEHEFLAAVQVQDDVAAIAVVSVAAVDVERQEPSMVTVSSRKTGDASTGW